MISISHFDNPYVLQQWEGLIELLGSESKPAGGLEFLHKYEHPLLSLLSYFHTFIYLLIIFLVLTIVFYCIQV